MTGKARFVVGRCRGEVVRTKPFLFQVDHWRPAGGQLDFLRGFAPDGVRSILLRGTPFARCAILQSPIIVMAITPAVAKLPNGVQFATRGKDAKDVKDQKERKGRRRSKVP